MPSRHAGITFMSYPPPRFCGNQVENEFHYKQESAFHSQHSMILADWMIKATCSRIKSHITCTFCFPMKTNRRKRALGCEWIVDNGNGKARRRGTRSKKVLNKIWVNLRVEKLNKEPNAFCSINSRCLLWGIRRWCSLVFTAETSLVNLRHSWWSDLLLFI